MTNENDNTVKIHAIGEWMSSKCVIFKIPVPSKQPAYMSIDVGYLSSGYSVVIVDAAKFLQLWRNNRHGLHNKVAKGNPATWRNDYKYRYAETGFASGSSNPVPLADLSCWEKKRSLEFNNSWFNKHLKRSACVAFTDGVTRTIWLLANGCSSFPVKCNEPGATILQNAAASVEWPQKITGDDVALFVAQYPKYLLYT